MVHILHICPINAAARDLYEDRVRIHNEKGGENSGFDLVIAEAARLAPNAPTSLLSAGIRAEMVQYPDGHPEDVSYAGYWLVPRSSIYKVPIDQPNSPGVIDPGYRGVIKIPVRSTRQDTAIEIEVGSRYFQLVHPSLEPFEVKIVDSLSDSARKEGGFGSTGNEGGVTV